MIEVQSLTKRYGDVLAVDNISFSIKKGEVVGLLGPNGAGKSTTLKILTTFLPASSGQVSLNGFDVFTHSLQVRQSIGYLPESCPLYTDMEVKSYLNFCAEARGLVGAAKVSAISRVLGDCGLTKVSYRVIAHLSKGFRQRVGLAQALLHNPSILILDEPTSGLDPNQIRDILQLIHNLGAEKTVIHSTHILSEVEKTSNRVLIINQGKIVGQGEPRVLMEQGQGQVIHATIKGDQAQGSLSQLPFVSSVQLIRELEPQLAQYAIQINQAGKGAPDIFQLCVQQGYTLHELRTETASLEDVFAKLTQNVSPNVSTEGTSV